MADKLKDLNSEERRELAAYMMRYTIGNIFSKSTAGIPPGTTVGDAIEQQKEFEAKERLQEAQAEALKARALATRKAAIDKMNHLITFAVVSKQYVPKNFEAERYRDKVAFIFAVKNNTGKAIAGIRGTVTFRDMFGSTIENVTISMDREIPANSEKTIDGYEKDLNQFENSDQQLAVTDLAKMRVGFEPDMIVFADGTSEKAPEESP